MGFRKVCSLEELWIGDMKGVQINGQKILLVHLGNAIHAFENRCAHQPVELSQGTLEGKILTCSAHHWQYDVSSGRGTNPTRTQLKKFPVQIHHGDIFVDVDPVLSESEGKNL